MCHLKPDIHVSTTVTVLLSFTFSECSDAARDLRDMIA